MYIVGRSKSISAPSPVVKPLKSVLHHSTTTSSGDSHNSINSLTSPTSHRTLPQATFQIDPNSSQSNIVNNKMDEKNMSTSSIKHVRIVDSRTMDMSKRKEGFDSKNSSKSSLSS